MMYNYIMCFNATIMTPLDVMQKEYNLKMTAGFNYAGYGDYKVAFTHPFLPIILENRVVELGQWGLIPSWVRECKKSEEIVKYTLNARIETLTEKPSFKGSVDKGRIVVLMDGFYEWKHVDGKKIPYYVSSEDRKPLLAAGLVSTWGGINTFSIITTEAQGVMREVHNTKLRMPFFLEEGNMDNWLDSTVVFKKLHYILPSYKHLKVVEQAPIIQ